MFRLVPTAVFSLVLIAAGSFFWMKLVEEEATSRLQPEDPVVVARGEAIYADNCASCHGADLSGEPGWPDWRQRKPDGSLAAPPHDESGHTWHHPDEMLFQITKLGTAAYMGDPARESGMPAFGDSLSDDEIAAALSFIKSTWKGQAKEANARINRQAAQQN